MTKKIKYYIIGGQYEHFNHGPTYSLEGAKRLATKCVEYWDNWQGWHKPAVYKAEDCALSKNWFGEDYYPKTGAIPYMTWNSFTQKWEVFGE